MVKRNKVPLKIIVVAHGYSEVCLCKNICSSLKIKYKCYSRNNGKNSIQIGSLLDVLKSTDNFKTLRSFKKHYEDIVGMDFKIFPIMDVDDCINENQKEEYISGEMFKGLWLANRIVPIYNKENLEDVLKKAGHEYFKTNKSNYIRVFPTNEGKNAKLNDVLELKEKFEKIPDFTNFAVFINECLMIAKENEIK